MADQSTAAPDQGSAGKGSGTGPTLEAAILAAAKSYGGHQVLTVRTLGIDLTGIAPNPTYHATVGAGPQTQSTPKQAPASQGATDGGGERKIYQVLEGGRLSILKTNPLTLQIDAVGETRTGGWSKFHLSPYIYVKPPQDGIYDFDFLGTPPTGIATQAITRCEAQERWEGYPTEHLKGVRIHAEGPDGMGQSVEIMLNSYSK